MATAFHRINFRVGPWNTKIYSQDVEGFCVPLIFSLCSFLELAYYFQGTTGPPGPRGREVSTVPIVLYGHQMACFYGSLPALKVL